MNDFRGPLILFAALLLFYAGLYSGRLWGQAEGKVIILEQMVSPEITCTLGATPALEERELR